MRFEHVLAMLCFLAAPACGVEVVTFRDTVYNAEGVAAAGPERTAEGQALRRDSQGGMILEAVDGALYALPASDVLEAASDDRPFAPLTHEQLGERLLAELPAGFRVHTTEHYVVAYDTSREYAEWTSSLLESLLKALVAYWKRQGLELDEPRFPLPIVIHASATAYQVAARQDGVGPSAVGYYSQKSNRVRMFDLTGSDELRALGGGGDPRRGSRRDVQRMLATPAAEPLVATIVHEATHQVAFNTGVMQRFADLPLWLVEGMAVYFEAPDGRSARGWRGVGKVNRRRYETFLANLPKWNDATLPSLVASDKRLRDPRTGGEAYADAWALNYYLIKRKPDAYVAYVKAMSEREPFDRPADAAATPKAIAAARLAEFTKHFGDLGELRRDLVETMTRL